MELADLVPLIRRITEGSDLTREEAATAFAVLEADDVDSYFYFTLLAALHTKGETSDELLGFCEANSRFVPPFDLPMASRDIIDLSGTGGDRIKTPNISTAAAFVAAAGGAAIVKQAFLAVTGFTGSADLLQTFGVDPLGLSQNGAEAVRGVFEKTGMVIYHANSMSRPDERRGYFAFWLERVPTTGLTFTTAYHLAANLYSPIPMRRRVYGVFAEKYMTVLADVFQQLGYDRVLVVHGRDGLDEISTIGETHIFEISEGEINDYIIRPSDIGLERASESDIAGLNRNSNIRDFLRILYGAEQGPKRDLVLANAASVLYLSDVVDDLASGVEAARAAIDGGGASAKLEEYVRTCGDSDLFDAAKSSAEL